MLVRTALHQHRGRAVCDPLVEYTEYINSRIQRKASVLRKDEQQELVRLVRQHESLGMFCLLIRAQEIALLQSVLSPSVMSIMPTLPLRVSLADRLSSGTLTLPDSILDATALRPLLEIVVGESERAVAEFDAVFGGRA